MVLGHGVTLTPGAGLDVYRSGSELRLAPEPPLSARLQLSDTVGLLHDVGIAHQAPELRHPSAGLLGKARQGLQRGVQTSAGAEWQLSPVTRATLNLFQIALFSGSDSLDLFQLDNADLSVDAVTDRATGHAYGVEPYVRRDLTRRLGGILS